MSNTWQTNIIYHAHQQRQGGYAVVRETDQFYVDATMFHRLMDAQALASGGEPEKRGKPISLPKHRWGQIFAEGRR